VSTEAEQVLDAGKLNDLRRRVLANEEVSKDELRLAVRTLLGERVAQAQSSATASRKRPSRTINLDDLLGDDANQKKADAAHAEFVASKTIDLSDI
jgi:hypothetical protein